MKEILPFLVYTEVQIGLYLTFQYIVCNSIMRSTSLSGEAITDRQTDKITIEYMLTG